MSVYVLHFDGSCGPKNPGGTAAYGYTIHNNGLLVAQGHNIIGDGPGMSNNYAEFYAMFMGLFRLQGTGFRVKRGDLVNVYGDSQIAINIISKRWRPSKDKLYWPAYVEAERLVRELRHNGVIINFDHIPREQNQECDALSKYDNLSQTDKCPRCGSTDKKITLTPGCSTDRGSYSHSWHDK